MTQSKNKVLSLLVGAALVTSVMAGGYGISTVLAEDSSTKLTLEERVQEQKEHYQEFVARVAEILGLKQSELDSAMKQARKENIDEMVEEGKLTEEEAKEAKERIDEGLPPRPRAGAMGPLGVKGREAIAEFLDMSIEDLDKARDNGKTIEDLLEEKGKTREELRSYMESPRQNNQSD